MNTGISLSQLPDILDHALQLLDSGAADAARVLADRAYHQAKADGALGKKRNAAKSLIRRAWQLQGDALRIESRANIALADAWDDAQENGQASKGGRPKTVSIENGFTAEEAGLTRNEIHIARQMRDAENRNPGIIEQAITARLERGLEPTKAAVRRDAAIGTRTHSKKERGDNFYQSTKEGVWPLPKLETFSKTIWEPACGHGRITDIMIEHGYKVDQSDLIDRGAVNQDGEIANVEDFLKTRKRKKQRDIVTNPPFHIANEFIAHAMKEHRPAKIAMFLNLNMQCGFDDPNRCYWMDEHPPSRIYVFSRRLPMMHREGYAGKKSDSPQMNCMWCIWELNDDGEYPTGPWQGQRIDWMDYVPEGYEK